MKNEVGLKHIALELGLSVVAVSRALKDGDDIGELTKHRVRQKAIELGYMPRPMKESKYKTIAVFIDSLVSSFFGMIAEKMIEEFKKHNYLIILIPTAQNFVCKENVKEALGLSVDAMISFLVPHDNAYEISLLHRVPFLLFGRHLERPKLNVVCMDDYLGGEIAASYKGVPQNDVGMNTDIFNCFPKEKGIEQAIRVMSPEFVVCDEIGNDTKTLLKYAGNGVKPILTVHCGDISEAVHNEAITNLISSGAINYIAFLENGKAIGNLKGLWCIENGKGIDGCNNSNNLLRNRNSCIIGNENAYSPA